jgi:hypothetical protein
MRRTAVVPSIDEAARAKPAFAKKSSGFSAIPMAAPVETVNELKKPQSSKLSLLIAALAGMGIGAALVATSKYVLFLSHTHSLNFYFYHTF